MKPYPVKISPELEQEIFQVLEGLEVQPVDVTQAPVSTLIFPYFYKIYLCLLIIFTKIM